MRCIKATYYFFHRQVIFLSYMTFLILTALHPKSLFVYTIFLLSLFYLAQRARRYSSADYFPKQLIVHAYIYFYSLHYF